MISTLPVKDSALSDAVADDLKSGRRTVFAGMLANVALAVITIRKDGETYSAASILDVLTANLDCGAEITVEADGPDAEEALQRLGALLEEFKTQEG